MNTAIVVALRAALLLAAVLLTGLLGWVVLTDAWPWLRGPGPWPPEWRWLHIPLGTTRPLRLGIHAGLLLIYAGFVVRVTQPQGSGRIRIGIAGAVTFLLLWQMVQTWVREESLLDILIFRTYAPPLNGYFVAPAQVESIADTLANYRAAMPTFFADKAKTHPPGLFLFYAIFQELFMRLEGLSAWFAPIARGWAIEGRDWPLLVDPLVTSAFVTSLLQAGLVSVAPASFYLYVRQMRVAPRFQGEVALWAALLLPLLPPLTGFFLQWDTAYPSLAFAAGFLALRGQNRLGDVGQSGWGPWLDWLWAGLLLSLLTWLSFGMAVFGLLIGLHVLWREVALFGSLGRRIDPLAALPTLGGLLLMAAGVVLPWLLAHLAWDMDFFSLLSFGLESHYALVTAARDYRVWWWMNLVDFGFWLGPGLAILGLVGSASLLSGAGRGRESQDLAGLVGMFWLVLLALNFSGTTRGEIGRLWIFLMPYPLLFALALPWRRRQRLVILAILVCWGWVLAYAIAPLACC